MRLVRYNPFNELRLFENTFNDFFNTSLFKPSVSKTDNGNTWHPAVDIVDEKDHVLLNVDLPGVEKENIAINIENRVLTITGERNVESEEKKENYFRRERHYGSFKRAFSLPEEIDAEEVNADYKDGILKITLKKDTTAEEVKKITIN